jgi:phosphate transport system substrate-binding protein
MATRRMPRIPPAFALLASMAAAPAWCQDRLILDGSTGMIPLARAVAAAYQRQAASPQLEIGQGLGTGARMKAVAEGRIHVALASHGVKPEDLQRDQLKAVEIARGAIVFAVHASVPVSGLGEAQVCDLFSGRIRNWQQLGGPDQPVVVLTRPPVEVDPEVIRAKLDCFRDLKEHESARVMPRGGDMAKALAETPYAVGMTSMTVVEQSSGKIRALALNDVPATPSNVRSGRYTLTRDFLFVVKAAPSPAVTSFLDFVLSPAGDRVIVEGGAIPLR